MAAATPWASATDKVLKAHKVSQDEGLTDDQVSTLREKYGPNELDKEEGTPLWQLVLDQFDDLLVKILLGAACLSFALAFAEEGDDFAQAMVEPFVRSPRFEVLRRLHFLGWTRGHRTMTWVVSLSNLSEMRRAGHRRLLAGRGVEAEVDEAGGREALFGGESCGDS